MECKYCVFHKLLILKARKHYYEVFSTYSIIAEDYYINTSFKNNNEFDGFIKKLKSRSIYNYGIEVNGEELYPLHGEFVNMEYPFPNGEYVKLLNDNEAYLGNQVECIFNDEDMKKCFGILAI